MAVPLIIASLDVKELAKMTGISRRAIDGYLNDDHCPQNYMIVIMICVVLELSFDESMVLMHGAGITLRLKSMTEEMKVHCSALTNTSMRTLKEWNDFFVESGFSILKPKTD